MIRRGVGWGGAGVGCGVSGLGAVLGVVWLRGAKEVGRRINWPLDCLFLCLFILFSFFPFFFKKKEQKNISLQKWEQHEQTRFSGSPGWQSAGCQIPVLMPGQFSTPHHKGGGGHLGAFGGILGEGKGIREGIKGREDCHLHSSVVPSRKFPLVCPPFHVRSSAAKRSLRPETNFCKKQNHDLSFLWHCLLQQRCMYLLVGETKT